MSLEVQKSFFWWYCEHLWTQQIGCTPFRGPFRLFLIPIIYEHNRSNMQTAFQSRAHPLHEIAYITLCACWSCFKLTNVSIHRHPLCLVRGAYILASTCAKGAPCAANTGGLHGWGPNLLVHGSCRLIASTFPPTCPSCSFDWKEKMLGHDIPMLSDNWLGISSTFFNTTTDSTDNC